jgi:tungstate transport system substrate-binding protein
MVQKKKIPAMIAARRNLWLTILSLTLIASMLACSLPFGGASPTAAPTDSGVQPPTQEGEQPTGEAITPGAPEETSQPAAPGAKPANNKLTVAVTTAIAQSGLLEQILPMFQNQTGYQIKLETGGAGRAFKLGEKGLIDVMLVDDPGGELKYIKDGYGKDRVLVMHSDFVLIGPADDPAGVKGASSAVEAFKKIASAQAKFVARGDDSAVSKAEANIWEKAGMTPGGDWYTKAEQGMEGTLKLASDKKAYCLTDRETYLKNKASVKLEILYEGDPDMFYVYHAITSDPAKSTKINEAGAQAFVQFINSPEIQAIIAQWGVTQYGQPIYFADAGKSE